MIRDPASFCAGRSESQAQCKLHLPRRICVGCAHEIGRHLVRGREVIDSNMLSAELKLCCVAQEAFFGDRETAIQTVEQVEGFGREFKLPSISGIELARESRIR